MKAGDSENFEKNWEIRPESLYNHWTRGEVNNQIQFAFRQHWSLFSGLMDEPGFNRGRRCLEIGCGRGSISAYFADAGFDCTLVDIAPNVIEIARNIFDKAKLKARFMVGDANDLRFGDGD